jgi:exopolysaccharide production protein ExoQ
VLIHPNEPPEAVRTQEAGRNVAKMALVTLILCAAFVSSDFDWYISTYPFYSASAAEIEARVEVGSPIRRIAMTAIGLLGASLLFLWPSPHRRTFRRRALLLLGFYIAVCCASIVWSDVPVLAAKRLVILGFCILGILGIVRHLTAGDLMNMALIIGLVFLALGLMAEINLGSFQPFSGDYRFAGTMHPNGQAAICATLTIAALCSAKGAGRAKAFYWLIFTIGFSFLFLTKSRGCLIGCVFAIYAVSFLGGTSGLRKFLAVGPPIAICAALLAVSFLGFDVGGELEQATHMGRDAVTSEINSLNGRAPLWEHLVEDVLQQPLLGYGYQSFWTAERITDVSSEMNWIIPDAHSLLVDTLLQVGFIGAIGFVLGIFGCVWRLVRRCFISNTPALSFALAMTLFAMVTSLLESNFADLSRFESFMTFSALIHVQTQPDVDA